MMGVHSEHKRVVVRAAMKARGAIGTPIRDLGPDYKLRREPLSASRGVAS